MLVPGFLRLSSPVEQSQVQKLARVEKLGFRNENHGFRNWAGSGAYFWWAEKRILSASDTICARFMGWGGWWGGENLCLNVLRR